MADRIVYQYDFAHGDDDASDYHGHGSNVSSIIASEKIQSGWHGTLEAETVLADESSTSAAGTFSRFDSISA